jgi:voltage-dependent calcium channel N type alpha-1B
MYIFTLMGMQFFAGSVKFNELDQPDSDGKSPRYNFNTFDKAFLTVFIIFTGENWNELMYDAMRATHEIA